jgi:hypothetical protein
VTVVLSCGASALRYRAASTVTCLVFRQIGGISIQPDARNSLLFASVERRRASGGGNGTVVAGQGAECGAARRELVVKTTVCMWAMAVLWSISHKLPGDIRCLM